MIIHSHLSLSVPLEQLTHDYAAGVNVCICNFFFFQFSAFLYELWTGVTAAQKTKPTMKRQKKLMDFSCCSNQSYYGVFTMHYDYRLQFEMSYLPPTLTMITCAERSSHGHSSVRPLSRATVLVPVCTGSKSSYWRLSIRPLQVVLFLVFLSSMYFTIFNSFS